MSDPIGPCGPAEQFPTGDSPTHAPTAALSSFLDWGANAAVVFVVVVVLVVVAMVLVVVVVLVIMVVLVFILGVTVFLVVVAAVVVVHTVDGIDPGEP